MSPQRRLRWLFLIVVGAGLVVADARAERLPFRAYGASEGLAGDQVRFILQDSRGFLWLATNAGVSRFDGKEFRNYSQADGLPFPSSRKVVEAPDGTLFVMGREKLVRRPAFPTPGKPEFEPVLPAEISSLVGDIFDILLARDGTLLLAGSQGMARLRDDRLERVDLGTPHLAWLPKSENAWAAAIAPDGALWVTRSYGITRIGADGSQRTLPLPQKRQVGQGWGWFPSMTVDRSGRVWLVTMSQGVWRLETDAQGMPAITDVIDREDGLPCLLVRTVHEGADGTLWMGTSDCGLVRVETSSTGRRFVRMGPAEGFPDLEVFAMATDAQANLWIGTAATGLVRLAVEGLTSWGAAEGINPASIWALHDEPQEGLIVVIAGLRFAAVRDGRVADSWRIRLELEGSEGWGVQQLLARGADGRLWLATGRGPAMYAPGTSVRDLATRAPERILTDRDGLPGNEVHRLFVARDGTVWFGLIHATSGVCRVGADGTGVRCFGSADGLPSPAEGVAFEEDDGGNIWFGLYEGGLYRYSAGHIESWPGLEQDKQTLVRSIRRDAGGRLWVAGAPGLLRVDAAESSQPSFRRFSTEDGLAPETLDTADDAFGRVYVGSVHGVDRMAPAGGSIRRFTMADGLPSNHVTALHRDPAGDIWVGTSRGLARLEPRTSAEQSRPRVFLTGVIAEGTPRDPTRPLKLGTNERTVEFVFTAPSFRAGETMRFQWRLVGSSDDWSLPGTARAVTGAGLSPGRYTFEVRAVDGEGLISSPESLAFRILPPVWQRGWFATLMAISMAGAAAALYRIRVARLLEVERVRTRIATDLHDDIGASLSQIAVLSQYAARQAERGAADARLSLERITELSGGVVDAMSDVVWSINPARDRMSDLVHRMRRFAVDLFSESDAVLRLDLPEDQADGKLDPEARRQVYLVFKEALRNAARHSGAREVEVSLRREENGLLLAVRDDGVGIASGTGSGGAGLENMRRRAAGIGGTLEIRNRPGGGSEVLLRTPNTRRGLLARWTGRSGATRP